MQNVKPQQRHRLADTVRDQNGADNVAQGRGFDQFHPDLSGPQGELIQWQQIAGVGFKDSQTKQRKTDNPIEFARLAISPG